MKFKQSVANQDMVKWREATSSVVSKNQVLEAANALQKHYELTKTGETTKTVEKQNEEKKMMKKKKKLFIEEDVESSGIDYQLNPIELDTEKIYNLIFTLDIANMSERHLTTLKGYQINLPHPFTQPRKELNVCLIVPSDRDKQLLSTMISLVKDKVMNSKTKQATKAEESSWRGLLSVKKMLVYRKLKKKYVSPQQKKELSMMYDMFLVDDRIVPSMAKTLGKAFVKGSKVFRPVKLYSSALQKLREAKDLNLSKATNAKLPKLSDLSEYEKKQAAERRLGNKTKNLINLSTETVERNLTETIQATFFYPRGVCCSVKVGRIGMTTKQVLENIMEAISVIVNSKIEKKWKGVVSINLKTGRSVALPIFNQLVGDISEERRSQDDTELADERTKRALKRQSKAKEARKKRLLEKKQKESKQKRRKRNT